jgi:hypothetical protein
MIGLQNPMNKNRAKEEHDEMYKHWNHHEVA